MTTSSNFGEITASLEESNCTAAFIQKRDPRVAVVDAFAAVNPGSKLEALLVGVPDSLAGNIDEWPVSDGFRVEIRPESSVDSNKVLICLQLSRPEYRHVFLALAEDLCGVLSEANDAPTAVRNFRLRLESWQEFLKKHRPDGLSEDEQVGLFGELYFLTQLLDAGMNPLKAVIGWRGSQAANQDFQFPGVSVEIKCTRATSPTSVRISNLRQLDDDAVGIIHLSVISIDRNLSSGISLPAVIATLRGRFQGEALAVFNESLRDAGYLDVQDNLYKRHLHQVMDEWHHCVDEGFPRLTRKVVPEGISGVTYKLSLAMCAPYRVDGGDLMLQLLNSVKEDMA